VPLRQDSHKIAISVSADPKLLPPRLLPVLYFALAHAALVLAFAAIAADARAASGFFYHSRMLAIVHLVTLGWITSSILGALYLVGPIAFRARLRANWLDYAAFALVAIGVAGTVSHFWIAELRGMAWSTPMVAGGILLAGARVLPAFLSGPVPRAVVAHVALAFVNIAGASTLGVLMPSTGSTASCPATYSPTSSRTRTSPRSDGQR